MISKSTASVTTPINELNRFHGNVTTGRLGELLRIHRQEILPDGSTHSKRTSTQKIRMSGLQ